MNKAKLKIYLSACIVILGVLNTYSQKKLQLLQLPSAINNINEEFSGITQYYNRIYFLPQYGSHYETKLKGEFNIYSMSADSINRTIEGKDSLHYYRTLKVKNLSKLPPEIVDNYQGFEAISIVNQQVYLPIETRDNHYYCYILKGTLDTVKNEINIDSKHYISIRRYPYIKNGGFESMTYLSKEKMLLVYYEFNAMPDGGIGYLVDPTFKKSPKAIKTPFLYFRVTDMATAKDGRLYAINSYYSGDSTTYLNNGILKNQEAKIKKAVPDLARSIENNTNYLKEQQTNYARIVTQKKYTNKQWQQVVAFDSYKNNWEGITLFKKGALIISDANRSTKQVTNFAYIEF